MRQAERKIPIRHVLGALLLALGSSACQVPDHHLIHPAAAPPEILTWTEDVRQGRLAIHLEGARPRGAGVFPAVIVHPEGGKTAVDMKGVIWDLARRGYVAVAADYKRRLDGRYRRNTFAWREDGDVTATLERVMEYPFVDTARIATLGFSQGGIYSLLIAAHAPDRIRAVVAYYPVTDFEYWLYKDRPHPIRRFVYRMIRRHFRKESGAETEEAFRRMLRRASVLPQAESIRAPVLLIHGDRDPAASIEESARLVLRLRELDRNVEFLVVPGGVHIFNFRQPELARMAWAATLEWLRLHL